VTLRAVALEESDESVLVRFEVEDSGIGILPETLSRLFSALSRPIIQRRASTAAVASAGDYPPTAELMSGDVGARSSTVCSTFWFTARLKEAWRDWPGPADHRQ